LVLPAERIAKLYKALRYEQYYFGYVGVTLLLGLYLTHGGFSQ
jgi:hypothetical protein